MRNGRVHYPLARARVAGYAEDEKLVRTVFLVSVLVLVIGIMAPSVLMNEPISFENTPGFSFTPFNHGRFEVIRKIEILLSARIGVRGIERVTPSFNTDAGVRLTIRISSY